MDEGDSEDGSQDRILCQETLADRGGYSFRILLETHCEYDSVVEIRVEILHGDTEVGHLKGRVIDRSFQPRWQFHTLCDSHSEELQEIGITFCNDDGTVRFGEIDGLMPGEDNPASSGGFLHIEMVSIREEHRHKDIGVRCVKMLLEFLNVRDARERQEHKAASDTWVRHLRELHGDEAAYIAWMRTRKSESDYLHAGWTLAVLATGLENTPEDHPRMFERARMEFAEEEEAPGGAVGAKRDRADEDKEEEEEEEGDKAERACEAAREVALRKVALQWARLGFRQARFASHKWYVMPNRLVLKSKKEVANLEISKLPEKQPPVALDRPLSRFFDRCAEQGKLASTWEADVKGHVAKGADLNRMHALHRAANLLHLEPQQDALLRLVATLGADINERDELRCTPLHCTAFALNHAGASAGAKTLLALGADRSAVDVFGDTPLSMVMRAISDDADCVGAFGLDRKQLHGWSWEDNMPDTERHKYDLLLEMITPPERAELLGGVLTPRQVRRMVYIAEVKGDHCSSRIGMLPTFVNKVPRASDEMEGELMPYWDHIPTAVRGEKVYKSFVYGFAQVIEAICEVIQNKQEQQLLLDEFEYHLPTIQAIKHELRPGTGRYDDRYTRFFFEKGGKVEHALDGFIDEAIGSEAFFDMMGDNEDSDDEDMEEDNEENDMANKYNSLPENPLDEQWDFVRYKLLGPLGKVPKGPFHDD